jgi:hypothetical protein
MMVGMLLAHGATTASKSALFVTPTHIAIQAVLHDVSAFKIRAVNFRGKYAYAAH